MNYIIFALGVVVVLALLCVILALCPIVFSFTIIAVDEFIKMCSWIKRKMAERNDDIIISRTEYETLTTYLFEHDDDCETCDTTNCEWSNNIKKDELLNGTIMLDEEEYNNKLISDWETTQTMYYDLSDFEDILKEEDYDPDNALRGIPENEMPIS